MGLYMGSRISLAIVSWELAESFKKSYINQMLREKKIMGDKRSLANLNTDH